MTKNVKTTAASKMLEKYIAPFDATVIAKLKAAGAVLLGKTNLDEFAHGSSTEYSAFGVTKNPWDLDRVAGGSGGSAAAVAADFLRLFALRNRYRGLSSASGRFCGVVGLKPSYGLCSRFGLIAMTSSTDVPGVLAKTTEDAALVLETLAGLDERDATTVAAKRVAYAKASDKVDLKSISIGVPKEYFAKGLSPKTKQAVEAMINNLKKAGAKIVVTDITKRGLWRRRLLYHYALPSQFESRPF